MHPNNSNNVNTTLTDVLNGVAFVGAAGAAIIRGLQDSLETDDWQEIQQTLSSCYGDTSWDRVLGNLNHASACLQAADLLVSNTSK
jgi:hypothetical protein